jgi:diguanylate cyclase (GGDEF)-like protein
MALVGDVRSLKRSVTGPSLIGAPAILEHFMPHGMCFAWQRNILLLSVVSDGLIALAYFSIPLTLLSFGVKRRDLPFKWLFAMFGTFIVACGTSHLFGIWTIWHPDYWQDVGVKAFTAVISIVTAVALVRIVPKALALRSPEDLERLNVRLEIATAELQATIESLGDGIIVFGEDRTPLRVNSVAAAFLKELDWLKRVCVDGNGVVLPEERWPSAMAFATGDPQMNVLVGMSDEPHRRWFLISATPLIFKEGSTAGRRVVVSIRDVTEMKAREIEQRNYARQLHSLHLIATMTTGYRKEQIDAALLAGLEPLGIERAFLGAIDITTDELVVESSVSAPGATTTPIPVGHRFKLRETFVGRSIESKAVITVLDLVTEARLCGLSHYESSGSYIAVPIYIDGSPYGAVGFIGNSVRTVPFSAENIEFVQLAGDLVSSAIQRAMQSERLDSLAFFDALTGLPNRVLLYDRLVQTILASQRRGERFSVLFLDLDGFKAVNDHFGHASGDAVLKVVAARLKESLRESDTVARLGGDEFVIVGTGVATLADATTFAERILRTMRLPITDGDNVHELTASIGVSFYPIDGTEMNTLIEQADIALYEAKQTGKNRVSFASARPASPASVARSTFERSAVHSRVRTPDA